MQSISLKTDAPLDPDKFFLLQTWLLRKA